MEFIELFRLALTENTPYSKYGTLHFELERFKSLPVLINDSD